MDKRTIEQARALARPYGQALSSVDASPAFVLQYVPLLGTGGAAATATLVLDTTLTFTVDAEAPAGLDAIGTSGEIDISAAAYDTVGELNDYINGLPAWRMYMVGAKYADGMETILAKASASCFGDNGLTFYFDASESAHISVAISGEKFVSNGIGGHVKDMDNMVQNDLLYAHIDCGMTAAGDVEIYSADQQSSSGTGATSTLLSIPSADDAENTIGEKNELVTLGAPLGHRLIVRAKGDTSLDDIVNFEVLGKSSVLTGDYIVSEQNW